MQKCPGLTHKAVVSKHGTVCHAHCSLTKHCLVCLLGLFCAGWHRVSRSTLTLCRELLYKGDVAVQVIDLYELCSSYKHTLD